MTNSWQTHVQNALKAARTNLKGSRLSSSGDGIEPSMTKEQIELGSKGSLEKLYEGRTFLVVEPNSDVSDCMRTSF